MEGKDFYHFFADGRKAESFALTECDFRYQFNLMGICSLLSGATVLSFTIEETHPHALLHGTEKECNTFRTLYSRRTRWRSSGPGNNRSKAGIDFFLIKVQGDNYLKNVASYTIIQPTKDRKGIMFYDYPWGTGPMYFRSDRYIPPWLLDNEGNKIAATMFGSLSTKRQRMVSRTVKLPENWLIAGGLILPENYVDVKMYEGIFSTHNTFLTFTSLGKTAFNEVRKNIALKVGLTVNDSDALDYSKKVAMEMYQTDDIRNMSLVQRIELAQEIKRRYHLSPRQVAICTRLAESDVNKYVF